MITDIDTVVDGFPHPTIPAWMDTPTYASIAEINLKLNANAASVHSNLGDGLLGHLALTVTPEVYNTLSATPFVTPVNPGAQPVIPALATQHVIAATEREHKEALRIWRQYNNTDKALKQQLLAAIGEMYYKTLCHRTTGYATIATRKILDHLYSTYGKITPADLADNDAKLKSPFDPSLPIEKLYDQVEDAQDLATAAGTPYTTTQIVTYTYNNVFQTGVFPDACRDWRRRPNAEKTWAQFKIDFALAHQELRESQVTAQGAGYHSANLLTIDTRQTTMEAFANLATATASDRSTVSQLSSTNSQLSNNLAETTAKLNTALADNQALKDKVEQLTNQQRQKQARNNSSGHGSSGYSTSGTSTSTYSSVTSGRKYNNKNYCHTHGYHIHDEHTSASCRWPKEGHQRDATRTNTKGGSTAGKDLVM